MITIRYSRINTDYEIDKDDEIDTDNAKNMDDTINTAHGNDKDDRINTAHDNDKDDKIADENDDDNNKDRSSDYDDDNDTHQHQTQKRNCVQDTCLKVRLLFLPCAHSFWKWAPFWNIDQSLASSSTLIALVRSWKIYLAVALTESRKERR